MRGVSLTSLFIQIRGTFAIRRWRRENLQFGLSGILATPRALFASPPFASPWQDVCRVRCGPTQVDLGDCPGLFLLTKRQRAPFPHEDGTDEIGKVRGPRLGRVPGQLAGSSRASCCAYVSCRRSASRSLPTSSTDPLTSAREASSPPREAYPASRMPMTTRRIRNIATTRNAAFSARLAGATHYCFSCSPF